MLKAEVSLLLSQWDAQREQSCFLLHRQHSCVEVSDWWTAKLLRKIKNYCSRRSTLEGSQYQVSLKMNLWMRAERYSAHHLGHLGHYRWNVRHFVQELISTSVQYVSVILSQQSWLLYGGTYAAHHLFIRLSAWNRVLGRASSSYADYLLTWDKHEEAPAHFTADRITKLTAHQSVKRVLHGQFAPKLQIKLKNKIKKCRFFRIS